MSALDNNIAPLEDNTLFGAVATAVRWDGAEIVIFQHGDAQPVVMVGHKHWIDSLYEPLALYARWSICFNGSYLFERFHIGKESITDIYMSIKKEIATEEGK